MEGLPLFAQALAMIFTVFIIVLAFYHHKFNYWKSRNINNLQPTIPFGNMPVPFKNHESFGDYLTNYYNEAKKLNWKHCGFYSFTSPTYFPIQLDHVKNVLIQDFAHFSDRGVYSNAKDDPLSVNLSNLEVGAWSKLRSKLTPTFTGLKIRTTFETFLKCQQTLLEALDEAVMKGESVDLKEFMACFTTDIIGSCVYGIECNSFKVKDSDFRKYGNRLFTTSEYVTFLFTLKLSYNKFARVFGARIVDKDVTDFFNGILQNTIAYREKNNVTNKDFLQLLIDLKNDKGEPLLTFNEISAQCYLFFVAGYETTSTTMTFALYRIAKHPDIQTRMREEIQTVLAKYKGEITYDAIQELKYMNQVIDEALRMYPPTPYVTRKCVKDYPIPGELTTIEKGTQCYIAIHGIHHDPEYYPEPETFDPERFNEHNRKSRHPCAFLPFGVGPRNCFGGRFGLTQIKVGLVGILKKYRISVNQKTTEPLIISNKSFLLASEGVIWLDAEKI